MDVAILGLDLQMVLAVVYLKRDFHALSRDEGDRSG
jgi:hypothetical protein